MRFDRRKIYPNPNQRSVLNAVRAIIPRRVSGVIKQPGPKELLVSVNRAVTKIEHHTQWVIPAVKMNEGGTSPFFGSRRNNLQGPGGGPPTAEITVGSGDQVTPCVITLSGIFPIGTTIAFTQTITGGPPFPFTVSVTTTEDTAAADLAVLMADKANVGSFQANLECSGVGDTMEQIGIGTTVTQNITDLVLTLPQ